MTLLIIMSALLIDRVLWDADPYRKHHWLRHYFLWLEERSWFQAMANEPAAIALQLVPVALLAAWLQSILHDSWSNILEILFGVGILLFSFGPKDLGRAAEAYLQAQINDPTQANQLANAVCNTDVPDQEPAQSLTVARCVLVEANNRIFAPLFWFLLLGPVGAVVYRCIYLLADWKPRIDEDESTGMTALDSVMTIADWIPARLTAIGYAIAGNFEAVAHIWRSPDSANQLLSTVGAAALDSYPSAEEIEHLTDTPPVVEDALALLWRTLSLWVIVLIIGSVIAWLA